jgi:hypothetical protein
VKYRNAIIGLIAIDAIAFVGVGMVLTFGVAAMLPYGHPQPSAAVVLIHFAARFVIAPVVCLLLLGTIAFRLRDNRHKEIAMAALGFPLLLWPMFLFEALK